MNFTFLSTIGSSNSFIFGFAGRVPVWPYNLTQFFFSGVTILRLKQIVLISFIIEKLLGHQKMMIILFFEHSFQPGILDSKCDSVYSEIVKCF